MMTTERVSAALEQALRSNPAAHVHLIIRTVGPAEERRERAQAFGLTVRHVFRLINALAISGRASDCLALAGEEWVARIEMDREMRTLEKEEE